MPSLKHLVLLWNLSVPAICKGPGQCQHLRPYLHCRDGWACSSCQSWPFHCSDYKYLLSARDRGLDKTEEPRSLPLVLLLHDRTTW